MSENEAPKKHFIQEAIEEDLSAGKFTAVQTRFPPEPNGYLHIGHSKAITIDFSMAEQFGGKCNLRFDDTNPVKEDTEYVDAIKEDIRWLGFQWDEERYTSDYFDTLYGYAVKLIEKGLAYVDDLTPEEMRVYRGSLTEPGRNSPYRERSVAENLDLFNRMKAGEFKEGARILRAMIDMAHPNLNMRDPALYRILHARHHRTGNAWCIYPTYDFAHGQSDSIEKVSHSLCSLEFEDHRPLYNWLIERLEIFPSRQIEFARLNLTYTVMSKRLLRRLVEEGHVNGWDDPRMPTLSGMRRRGYTPEAIKAFLAKVGVTKFNSVSDIALLEHSLRDDLNKRCNRVMGVLDPLKVVITNYPEDQVEEMEAINNPEDPEAGSRSVPFSRELYIEREDFMEDPPKKFFRLGPGREVRLRYAYYITCQDCVKNDAGEVVELHCTYDPETQGGDSPDGRKVKGTLHWVSAAQALKVQVRLYDRLFAVENPNKAPEGGDFTDNLNTDSMAEIEAFLEPSMEGAAVGSIVQFERNGYFCVDQDSTAERLVFNRTVTLRDSWAKQQKR